MYVTKKLVSSLCINFLCNITRVNNYTVLLKVFGKGDKSSNSLNRSRSPRRDPGVSSLDEAVNDEGSVSKETSSLSPEALKDQLDQLQALATSVQEKDMSKKCTRCACSAFSNVTLCSV